jgi:isopenicillin-N epimerase
MDWTGTGDPTPWLAVPEAIRVMNDLVPGGWPDIRRRNRNLVLEGRRLLCAALDLSAPAPDEMVGALASIPLSDGGGGADSAPIDPLQDELWQRFGIEVPVITWPAPPHRLLRISAQLYNAPDEYRYLAEALKLCCRA